MPTARRGKFVLWTLIISALLLQHAIGDLLGPSDVQRQVEHTKLLTQ